MNVRSAEKYSRGLWAVGYAMRYPALLKTPIKELIKAVYKEGALVGRHFPRKSLDRLVDTTREIKLQNFMSREGNVTPFELMAIALFIAHHAPLNLLEIGTFDGTTTLQMALNSPPSAVIHTIDLPPGQANTSLPIAQPDLKFVQDQEKLKRKYRVGLTQSKIVQHLSDSTVYDFNNFTREGLLDFCFIDGGHSYDCVKSDTERTFEILSPKGIILWHDFDPNCPGVYRYLCELSAKKQLVQIQETSLVALMPG